MHLKPQMKLTRHLKKNTINYLSKLRSENFDISLIRLKLSADVWCLAKSELIFHGRSLVILVLFYKIYQKNNYNNFRSRFTRRRVGL